MSGPILIPGFPPGSVRVNAQGLASLADMHQFAGGASRNRPFVWLGGAKARKWLKANFAFEAVVVIRGGKDAGTWAHPAIARRYACHLAPRHHPWHRWPEMLDRFEAPEYWPQWSRSRAWKERDAKRFAAEVAPKYQDLLDKLTD